MTGHRRTTSRTHMATEVIDVGWGSPSVALGGDSSFYCRRTSRMRWQRFSAELAASQVRLLRPAAVCAAFCGNRESCSTGVLGQPRLFTIIKFYSVRCTRHAQFQRFSRSRAAAPGVPRIVLVIWPFRLLAIAGASVQIPNHFVTQCSSAP